MGSQHTTNTIASNMLDDIFNNGRGTYNIRRPNQQNLRRRIVHHSNLISITIVIKTDRPNPDKYVLNHKFKGSDTILAVKQAISNELRLSLNTINLYHLTMDWLFEDDKSLDYYILYYRITDSYTMRLIPPSDDCKELSARKEKIQIDKDTFIKTSKTKKNHYANFPTLADYAKQSSSNNAQKVNKLTKEILSKTPSGDPAQKDTLLHILNGAAKLNGKKCSFFDSTKNIKSDLTQNSYLNAVDGNDDKAAKFVVVLNTLDQFVEEQKYDKADKLLELKEAITNNEDNQVINGVRNKLATAHGVSVDRIVIMDIYINGNAFVYRVTDLTDTEKDKIIAPNGQFQDKMQKLFDDYDKCAIHPALFEQSYDISMFDKLGNKTFGDSENGKYKVGPPGKEREYRQPTGWTRYGLKVLGKYGDDKWLKPFQDPGNWYRAFHGTTREAGSSIFKGAFRPGSHNAYGVGVYCSPDVNIAAGYCRSRGGTIKLDTKQGQKEFYFVFQVAVNPATMNNPQYIPRFDPSCENCDYWIAPSGADIRPYGILIKEV